MSLVTNSGALAALCQTLAKYPFVTVDTEFLRETTFWPKVCVIQLACDDHAFAIDAIAEDLDLTPFFELMANPDVVKVFHAARQDLEIIWHLAKIIPAPLFDTQVAAMVCGYGDQIAYGELAQSICKVTLDKSSRFTDWSRRPLSEAQIVYAIADVTHLRDIYKALRQRLEKTDRLHWLADEMATLSSPDTYEQRPDRAWERHAHRARKPRDLAVLMELAAWREHEAQTRDVPRSRVLKDDILIEVALAAPRSAETLGDLRAFPRGMEKSRAGVDILAAIERGLARDPKDPAAHRSRTARQWRRRDHGAAQGFVASGGGKAGCGGQDDRHQRRVGSAGGGRQGRRSRAKGLAARVVRREGPAVETRAAGADGGKPSRRHAGISQSPRLTARKRKVGQVSISPSMVRTISMKALVAGEWVRPLFHTKP